MKFDTLNFETWDYATKKALNNGIEINGKTVYIHKNNKIEKYKLIEFMALMKSIFSFLEKDGKELSLEKKNKAIYSTLEKLYKFNTDVKKMKADNNSVDLSDIEKPFSETDLFEKLPANTQKLLKELDDFDKKFKEDLKIEMSDEIHCGYRLSLAQAAVLSYCTKENKEKVCNIVQNCLKQKLGKNRLRQILFDEFCNIDNYLFSDLVYCISKKEEYDLMYGFYSSFDDIDEIQNDCYLEKHPEILNSIKDYFEKQNDGYSYNELKNKALKNKHPDNIINIPELIKTVISRGFYSSDIEIPKQYEKSAAIYNTIKTNPTVGYLTEYELCKFLEAVHADICNVISNKNLSSQELYDLMNYHIQITNTINADIGYIDFILEPFELQQEHPIFSNKYFLEIKRKIACDTFSYISSNKEKNTQRIYRIWTQNDTEILKNICSRLPSSLFIINFFKTYFIETGRMEQILDAQQEADFDRIFSDFIADLKTKENLIQGSVLRRDIITGRLFFADTRSFYQPCYTKSLNNTDDDLSKLLQYSQLIGKCPTIKELDNPTYNDFNEVQIKDCWYHMPTSKYYKEKYGSIKNAFNLIKI